MDHAIVAVVAGISQTASESSPPTLGIFVANLVIGGIVGFFIGNWRGRPVLGTVLGALLGCLGWIITAVLSKKRAF